MPDSPVPARRIVPKLKIDQSNVVILAPVDGMLEQALSILQKELIAFSALTRDGKQLNATQAKVLTGYIKALVDLSRESRERDKSINADDMSLEQLVEWATSEIERKKQLEAQKIAVLEQTKTP